MLNIESARPYKSQYYNNNTAPQKKDKTAQEVVAGAGATAAVASSAKSANAVKNSAAGSQTLKDLFDTVTRTTQQATKNIKETEGLLAKFKTNTSVYSKDILSRLYKFKNAKFIGPIIKSPVTKGIASIGGGALAFFMLVTGVNEAVNTGKIAINDFSNKFESVTA